MRERKAKQSRPLRPSESACAERGLTAQLCVFYREEYRELLRHEAKANGVAVVELLSGILDEALTKFVQRERTPEKQTNPLDLGVIGVTVKWSHRNRGYDSKGHPHFTHAVLITATIAKEQGKYATNATFHAGSPATLTQEKLDNALAKACVTREHYNRIVRGEIPFGWPPVNDLLVLYKDLPRPKLDLAVVMAELEKDHPQRPKGQLPTSEGADLK